MNTAEASTVLKEGTLVSTRVGTSGGWYNNIVLKLEDQKISLSLINSYLENTILVDTNMSIKYTNEFFEYLFEGSVVDIDPNYPGVVTISIKKADELVNTRFFPRYDAYLASTIKTQYDNDLHFSVVNNICLGGMAFISKVELEYGEEAEVLVYLNKHDAINVKGKIIRKNKKANYYSYSMQFTEMLEESSNQLANYLSAMDERNCHLQNHFFECIKDKLK